MSEMIMPRSRPGRSSPRVGERYPNLANINNDYWPEPIRPQSMETIPLNSAGREPRRHPVSRVAWCLTCQRYLGDDDTPMCTPCTAAFDSVRRRRQRYANEPTARVHIDVNTLRDIQAQDRRFRHRLARLAGAYAAGDDLTGTVEEILADGWLLVNHLEGLPRIPPP